MPADLRAIRTFKELTRYLEDQLDWPLDQYGFDDLTFSYEPPELGLKPEDAVKVRAIHQLRPFRTGQPWGIFFVEFEKKRLPVVVLRRILRHLVLKKRASANAADAKRWQSRDLLFISAWGDDEKREMTFAHFVEHPELGLSELRVLGWDDDDTPLHMNYVADRLGEKLRWTDALAANPEAWRKQWSDAFLLRHRHVITKSEELAAALAELAKRLRSRIRTILRAEDGFGEIRKLQRAFQAGLIHDLDDDGFADMFAQTVTYGLFSLACRRTVPGEGTAFVKDDLSHYFTSPFLKEMLGIFLGIKTRRGKIDFDELGVSDVTDLLTSPDTHMEVVLADFGNKTRGEDPVVHFYERFLTAYNKQLKIQRGVFYTPQPAVSYIVRSVHELLQTEFGLADGLADITTWGEMLKKHPGLKLPPKTDEPGETRTISPDEPFVQILDIATGTGTFIVEVIDVAHKTMVAKWKQAGKTAAQIQAAWNDYVPKHLLPRIYGFELMMAPYAIAHMKVGLKLSETGYLFRSDERVCIYLTNSLEPKVKQLPQIGFDALAHEAAAVNEIKWYKRFTVVIGNPPYAQYSMNLNAAAKAHIEKFRSANGQKIRARNALQLERNLNDDYVKFLGFSLELFPRGTGVLGMITNRMFLDSESLVGLREWLATNFEQLRFVDLWGSSEESRRVERLAADENVFDILQGVAVSFAVCRRDRASTANPVMTREVVGTREEKYRLLTTDLELRGSGWDRTQPEPEDWWLHRNTSGSGKTEHEFTLAEIFPQFSTLVASNRDQLVVGFDMEVVIRNVKAVQSFRGSNKDWSEQFDITLKTGWNVDAAREKLSAILNIAAHVKSIEYRAFDRRWIFFHPTLVWQSAPVSSNNVLRSPSNRVLISLGKNRAETTNGHWVSATLADKSVVSTRDNASGFPLYLFDDDGELGLGSNAGRPNIAPEFLRYLAARLNLSQEGQFSLPRGLTPEDIFHYAYAVLHSPGYRSRYAEFLKIDFPRLPLTGNLELFRALARLGGELTALHLLESPLLDVAADVRRLTSNPAKGSESLVTSAATIPKVEFIGGRNPVMEKISWSRNTVWVDKAQTTGFKGVREDVWNFHIGGYQVCEKWLKDRKGRALTQDDLAHYQKIIVALSETMRLMAEIDELVENHGGWPLK